MLVARILLALGLVGVVGCAGTAPPVRTNSGAHPPQLADVILPINPSRVIWSTWTVCV